MYYVKKIHNNLKKKKKNCLHDNPISKLNCSSNNKTSWQGCKQTTASSLKLCFWFISEIMQSIQAFIDSPALAQMLFGYYRFVTLVNANNSIGLFKILTRLVQWHPRQNFLSCLLTSMTADDMSGFHDYYWWCNFLNSYGKISTTTPCDSVSRGKITLENQG